MAENILAAACESETRKAAKRMRLEMYQTSQVPACCQLPGAPSAAPQVPRPRVQREQAGRPQAGEVLGWAGGRGANTKALQTSERPLDFLSRPKMVFSQAGTDQICMEHR